MGRDDLATWSWGCTGFACGAYACAFVGWLGGVAVGAAGQVLGGVVAALLDRRARGSPPPSTQSDHRH